MLKLTNLYEDYLQAPAARRDELLERYANLLAPPGSPADLPDAVAARQRLRVMLMPRSHHNQTVAGNVRDRVFCREVGITLGEHLVAEIAIDHPEQIHHASQSLLDSWNMSIEEAVSHARDNLRKMSISPFIRRRSGLLMSPWGDNYDASRVILTDLVEDMKLAGDPIAMVPHRDMFLVAGSDDEKALADMVALVKQESSKSRFISSAPLRLMNGKWESYLPPQDTPARRQLRLLANRALAQEYANRRRRLHEAEVAAGRECFVANMIVAEPDTADQRSFTIAVWSSATTLLPAADYIAFVDIGLAADQSVLGHARLQNVVNVLGDRLERIDGYPTYYRTDRFPSGDELRCLELEPIGMPSEMPSQPATDPA